MGARRRGDLHRRRAERLQHQPRGRLDRARGADPQGARAARRCRHRPRRRRRPRPDRRREGPQGRRRPAHGAWSPAPGRRTAAWRSPASSPPSCPISASSAILGGIGLGLVRTAVGDRYVLEHMRAHGYNLGGEQSGHIIMSDYTTTGDGLIAALQLLAVVKRLGQAGLGSLPLLRAPAAGAQERALQGRQAAAGSIGHQGHRGRPRAPRAKRAAS